MKTDALIALLSRRAPPVRRGAAGRRIALALGLALPLSIALMLALYGVRPDLGTVAALPMFWLKVGFPVTIALTGVLAVQRLGRPGVAVGHARWGLLAPVLLVWALGLWQWFDAPAAQRMPLLLGHTWRSCAFSIALIGAPVLLGALVALRSLAPTRPAHAGAAAGALAGGAGAAVYALHCPEVGAPFLAVWYVAGIALSALLGTLLGARWLRW